MAISDAANSDLSTVISSISKFVEAAVLRHEGGDKLNSGVEALALYNIVLIRPGQNHYDVPIDDWIYLENFVRGDSTPTVMLDDTEKEVISMSLAGNLSYRQLADMMVSRLIADSSNKASCLLKVLENLNKMTDADDKEEDILITKFIQPLLVDLFLHRIADTKMHGNGHALYESYVRKVKMALKYGLSDQGIKGCAPDRSITVAAKGSPCLWLKQTQLKVEKTNMKSR